MDITKLIEFTSRMDSEVAYILHVLKDENRDYLFRNLTVEIESMRKSLISEQHRIDASRAGYSSEYKAACRLLKGAIRDDLKNAWKNEKGQICACDGFTGIRLTDPKYALPLADKQLINLDKLMDDAAIAAVNAEENMPDYAALKTYYKTITADYKARYTAKSLNAIKDANSGHLPILYKFESNGAYVLIEYLLTAMEIVPDGKFYTSKSTVHPVYIKGESAEAMVLPIRVNIKNEPTTRADEDSAALRAGTYFDSIPA